MFILESHKKRVGAKALSLFDFFNVTSYNLIYKLKVIFLFLSDGVISATK